MSWNSYAVPAASPATVQVRVAPIVVPASGVAHVPWVTLGAAPQPKFVSLGARSERTSYCAAWPVPSSTSVKESVTELASTPVTARFVTVPGFPAGGAVTVRAAVPFLPSLVAVIVAVPAATPVTSPLPLTVATAAALLAHVTVRPVSGAPLASFGVAVSCTVAPAATLAVAGLTVTVATGTVVTVRAAVPLLPSLVAVIVAVPAAPPVTSPLPLTAATAVALLAHVTTRPVSGAPPASFGVAVSCTVPPTSTLGAAGL